MKKIVYLSLLLFLFVPAMVLADAGGPSTLGYDAIVINKNGAKSQSDENPTVVKYNTKIFVFDEYDNKVVACINGERQYYCENSVTLNISDIAPAKSEVSPSDLKTSKNDEIYVASGELKFIIGNKKGAKLKKGPADAYGSYSNTVPFKTILTAKYFVSTYGPGGNYYPFVYVDSNGYKGWIDSEDILSYSNEEIIAMEDVKLYDGNGNVIATVPGETVLKGYYGSFYGDAFVTYNDQLGYGEKLKFAVKSNKGQLLTIEKANITSPNGDVRGAIPAGEKVKILYAGGDDDDTEHPPHSTYAFSYDEDKHYYYVEYNGVKGLVSWNDVTSLYYEYEEKTTELKEEKVLYDSKMFTREYVENETLDGLLSKYKKIETIPKSGTVTYYSEGSFYDSTTKQSVTIELVKYKGKIGCILTIDKDEEEPTPVPSTEPTTEPTIEPKPTVNPTPSSKSENILWYCIAGGVLLAIAAIGTIIVINKKRKKKNQVEEPVVPETKEEPKPALEEETKEEVQDETKTEETSEENNKE